MYNAAYTDEYVKLHIKFLVINVASYNNVYR